MSFLIRLGWNAAAGFEGKVPWTCSGVVDPVAGSGGMASVAGSGGMTSDAGSGGMTSVAGLGEGGRG